jgi:DNA-binding response OmpR family regulator
MTRVLVIEDDQSVGAAIQMMLACKGCETVLAPDANAGVEAFKSSKFDVVMVDIFMPGVDGLKTIKGIRERAPSMPIVAMTGFRFRDSMGPGLDVLGMAAELGATSCLRKPFAPEQLMVAINSGLDPALSLGHLGCEVSEPRPKQ